MDYDKVKFKFDDIKGRKDFRQGKMLMEKIKEIDINTLTTSSIISLMEFDIDMFFVCKVSYEEDVNEECLMFYSDNVEYFLEELIRRKGYEALATNEETVRLLIHVQDVFDLSYKYCEAAHITKQVLNYNDLSDREIAERELKGIMNYMTYYSFIKFTDEERKKYTKLYEEIFNHK